MNSCDNLPKWTPIEDFIIQTSFAYFPYKQIDKMGGRLWLREYDIVVELIKGHRSVVYFQNYDIMMAELMPEDRKRKLVTLLPKILKLLYDKFVDEDDFNKTEKYEKFMKEYNHFMQTGKVSCL